LRVHDTALGKKKAKMALVTQKMKERILEKQIYMEKALTNVIFLKILNS